MLTLFPTSAEARKAIREIEARVRRVHAILVTVEVTAVAVIVALLVDRYAP